MSGYSRWPCCALAIAGLLAVGGCVRSQAPPPEDVGRTDQRGYFNLSHSEFRPVLVVGEFRNPASSPISWRDIGAGITQALSRELRAEGTYDVWIRTRIEAELDALLDATPAERAQRIEAFRAEHPGIRYVLRGRVTDFLHEGEPTGKSRTWFGSSAKTDEPSNPVADVEALVAVDISVIDLEAQRVALSDHVTGRAPANGQPSRDLYRDVSFDSYRFWDTPLGMASRQAIDRIVQRVLELPPPSETDYVAISDEEDVAIEAFDMSEPRAAAPKPEPQSFSSRGDGVRIEKQINPRRVRVVTSRMWAMQVGQTYYVSRLDPATGELVCVPDRDTGRPLKATIVKVGRTSALAHLNGVKPVSVELRGSTLTRQRAAAPIESVTRVGRSSPSDPIPIR